MAESERHIEAVQYAVQLMACYERDEGLRLEDLHERTGLTRSRIIRMAGTLVHEGFLTYDARTGRYLLGPNLYRLGSLVEHRYRTFKETARPGLQRLVHHTGFTAMFSVVSGQDRLVFAKEEPDLDLRFTVHEGRTRKITAGATGRVLLAFAPENFRTTAISQSDLSHADRQQLAEKLKRVAIDRLDFSCSELTKHAFALAVPVLTEAQHLIGALTLAGPAMAYDEDQQDRLLALLSQEAEALQRAAPARESKMFTYGSGRRPGGVKDAATKHA